MSACKLSDQHTQSTQNTQHTQQACASFDAMHSLASVSVSMGELSLPCTAVCGTVGEESVRSKGVLGEVGGNVGANAGRNVGGESVGENESVEGVGKTHLTGGEPECMSLAQQLAMRV